MALTLPYPTYTPFIATTVHSSTEHNAPHAGLLSNDVAIKGYLDTIDTTIAGLVAGSVSIGYKFATAAGPQTTTTSYANFVSTTITKQSASSILFAIGKCPIRGSCEAFTESIYYAAVALGGSVVSNSEARSSMYNASANAFTSTLIPMSIITGVAAGATTMSLMIKYSGYASAPATLGSLIIFEILNPFTL